MQHPGKNGRCRRLAVGAADQKCLFAVRDKAVERLGHGAVVEPHAVQFSDFRVVPDNGIADDDQVRGVGDVILAESVHNPDAFALQKMAHGRIDFLIGAGDFVAKILQHAGKRPHTGAAHGNQMDRAHVIGNSIFIFVQHHQSSTFGCWVVCVVSCVL